MSNVYPLKCRVRNEDSEVTRVDIFDDIGDYGWFGGISAQEFVSQMATIKGAVECHINSGGGDVFDGIAIANAMRAHNGTVTTIVDGIAASIASVIAQAGSQRIAEPGAMLMIHEAFGVCGGDAAEMAKMAEVLDKVSGNIADIYAGRAGGTPESWRDAMREETWYTAEEAVAAGLADKVGAGSAELPAGLDLAAFTSVPGRIAARLREMPVMKAPAKPRDAAMHPYDGEHSHSHSAYGAADADGDGNHSHDHAHSDDGDHDHSHDGMTASDAITSRPVAGDQSCEALGHQCCRDAATAKDLLAGLVRAEIEARQQAVQALLAGGADPAGALKSPGLRVAAADGKEMHGDHERRDPDGDGDCDACAEGDTDHDYWTEEGQQIQPLPDEESDGEGLFTDAMGHVIRAAAADESSWDGPAAMSWASSQDNPESAFRSICAGEKTTGEPDTQDHWALPHHKHSGDAPNRAGVSAALGRLNQTDDLKSKAKAEDHLKAHQSAMGGGDDADNHEDAGISGIDLERLGAQLSDVLKGARA